MRRPSRNLRLHRLQLHRRAMAASLPFFPSTFRYPDLPVHHTSKTAYVSPLALLKILTHAAHESPVAVMGVLLGKEVDAFTVRVVDAFPLPGCPLWSLDRAYIDPMLLMLHQTNRVEGVVGWYRSHPGFDCRPSDRDVVFTGYCFEELNPRAILVIVDPIKSVKGNFVINAFQPVTCAPETTSNIGSMQRKLYCHPVIEKPFFQEYRTVRRGFPDEDLFALCWFPDTVESDKKNAEEMLNDVLIKYQK
ncbi:hypothetical protein ABZP36_002371 [Zizania latifolia]